MEYYNQGQSRQREPSMGWDNGSKNSKLDYGYGTLLVLILFAVFSSYGIESYITGLEENRMARRDINFKQAVYAAEGGIEWAKAILDKDPLFLGGDITIGDARVRVTIVAHVTTSSEEGMTKVIYEVTSDALYGSDRESASARCTLKVEMEKNSEKWSILKYRESTI